MKNQKRILVTGAAGFIGSHLVERLLDIGYVVDGVDNFDPYYAKEIKESNITKINLNDDFTLAEIDIQDFQSLKKFCGEKKYHCIIHLAAKAGVRPSIEDPINYQKVNVAGTQNILELAKHLGVKQFVFGSSSSVYGINPNTPWKEDDLSLKPISPYASTKISGELMGHVYSQLYGIRFLALRFFTVFGPRQRPDLAIHKFVGKISNDKSIPLYGDGTTSRDYTFVSDIVKGIELAMDYDKSMFEIFNIGSGRKITLLDMVRAIEDSMGKKADIDWLPEQPGDVRFTYADISKAKDILGYTPSLSFKEGIDRFFKWHSNS